MKVNVLEVVRNRSGEPILDEGQKEITRAICLVRALDLVLPVDANDKASDVKKKWGLIDRITKAEANGGMMELEAAESAMLQERVVQLGRLGFPTTVLARVCLALEGESSADDSVRSVPGKG